jgi:hypothetical protein
MGAVCSGDFELDSRANGESFCRGWSFRDIELEYDDVGSAGSDHNRRWSPDVASRSVVCLFEEGGSHKMRVTG